MYAVCSFVKRKYTSKIQNIEFQMLQLLLLAQTMAKFVMNIQGKKTTQPNLLSVNLVQFTVF